MNYLLLKEDFLIEFGLGAINWTLHLIYLSYDYEDDLNGGKLKPLLLFNPRSWVSVNRLSKNYRLYALVIYTVHKHILCNFFEENDENPEDCIPDLPENKDARQFLAHAPSKGLWMPLGKEVKVMKCEDTICCSTKYSSSSQPTALT